MWITVRAGDHNGDVVHLDGAPVTIGRGPECDVVLTDPNVSHRHARLVLQGDGHVELRDLGSTNGTFVDGRRIDEPTLLWGAEDIRLGTTHLRLVAGQPSARHESAPETTRYLCAAAYLDPRFRDDVLTQVFEERHRFVAPSYGVDVAAVVRHCLAARRRERIRNALLAAALAGLVLARSEIMAGLVFVVAWAIVWGDAMLTRYSVLAGDFSRGHFDAGRRPGHTTPRQEQRVADLARAQFGNVVVYSGYSPFVGAGFEASSWSLAINIRRGAAGLDGKREEPASFAAESLHRHLAQAASALPIDGIEVTDRLFVSGQHIRDDRRFLANKFSRPGSQVDPGLVQELLAAPTPTARVYLHVRVVDWNGELVFSSFVRFRKTGECLFMEVTHYVLPSLRDTYHFVDSLTPRPTLRQLSRVVVSTLLSTPFVVVAGTAKTIALPCAPIRTWRRDRAVRRAIRENQAFDYGAETSIRERGTSSWYQRRFQLLDKEMYLKVINRHVIDAVTAFLDDKGVDTTDLSQQAQHIYNTGTIITGDVHGNNVVSGEGAKVTTNTVKDAVHTAAHAVVSTARSS